MGHVPNINKKQMSSCSHTESQRGMTFGTWNLFESGHRNGVPDGVGATIRRMSDRIVHQGSDCKDATDMYTNLKSAYSKVQLYLVPAEVIEISTQAMLSMVDLKTVPVGIQIMIL